MSATARFQAFLDRRDVIPVAELFAFFDGLPPVPEALMIGEWSGGVLLTGHPGEALLGGLKWAGKAFHDRDRVEPLVCFDGEGKRAANPVMGGASLREVVYRGVATATMIYDKHPIFDHFKRIDDQAVLGAMDRKGEGAPLFFYLRRL